MSHAGIRMSLSQSKNTGIAASIIFSMLCFYLSLAPFTPAILGTFLMLCVTGIYAFLKYYKTAFVLLAINGLAIYFHIDLIRNGS